MNAADLIDRIAEAHKIPKTEARKIVDTVFQAITSAAAKGDEVSLPGFGKFKVQKRPAREGRNPRTGATMKIAASRKLVFQPAKSVRDALN